MSNDIIDIAWQQSHSPSASVQTIGKVEAISVLKQYHQYSADGCEDAYLRSVDLWEPAPEEIKNLQKQVEGVSDSEVRQKLKDYVASLAYGEAAAINPDDVMARSNADAEKRRAELLEQGVSEEDAERRIEFYLAERKRLAFGDGDNN